MCNVALLFCIDIFSCFSNKQSAELLKNTKKELEDKINVLQKKYDDKEKDCKNMELQIKVPPIVTHLFLLHLIKEIN